MSNSLSEKELEAIILDGRLVPFVLGKDEFLTDHPGVDYSRWSQLKLFYRNLNDEMPIKGIIDSTIVNLYSNPDESIKYVAISLGRVLQLPAIRQMIINSIANSEIKLYSANLQNEFLFSATMLQLQEVATIVVKRFVEENRLGEFLLCSSIPPYVDKVGEDDIWRIKALERFFKDSDKTIQTSIYSQMENTAKYGKNFRLIVQEYISLSDEDNSFCQTLKKVLANYQ